MPAITNISQLDLNKKYTYADYLTWQLDEVVELIQGKVFRMPPAPNMVHRWVSNNLSGQISDIVENTECRLFSGSFDVRLPLPTEKQTEGKIDTVVQPDICVVCDPDKLDEKGCNGAPDWIIEILLKGTSKKDLTEKFDIYQNAGVKEYWIVHPYEETVMAFFLNSKGKYESVRVNPFVVGEKVPVGIFPGFELALEGVFPKI